MELMKDWHVVFFGPLSPVELLWECFHLACDFPALKQTNCCNHANRLEGERVRNPQFSLSRAIEKGARMTSHHVFLTTSIGSTRSTASLVTEQANCGALQAMVWFSFQDGWNEKSYVEAVSFCAKKHMKCPGISTHSDNPYFLTKVDTFGVFLSSFN